MTALERALQALESGKTIRLDGLSAGVYFASDVQQFWEAVREFEARGAGFSLEVLE